MARDSGIYRVGVTRNCLELDGERGLFTQSDFTALGEIPGLSYEVIPETGPALTSAQTRRYDAIFALTPQVSEASFDSECRTRHLAMTGAGFDTVDLEACARAGILVTNTPDAVAKPVAISILSFILILAYNLRTKEKLTRTGGWAQRTLHMGDGLSGKTVASLGFGNIAREMFKLLKPFDVKAIAWSPNSTPARMAAEGVRLVGFDELFQQADFLCINCPLNEQTRHLVDKRALALMRIDAFLINTSRGPIVDEAALYRALSDNRLAGAGLDVFEIEPILSDNPLLTLENVIVTPHAACWSADCFSRVAERVIQAIVTVMQKGRPDFIVNPALLDHPQWRHLK